MLGQYIKYGIVIIFVACLFSISKPDLTYAGFRIERDKIRPFDRTNLALAYIDTYKEKKDNKILLAALRQCNIAGRQEKHFYLPYRIRGYIYFLQGRHKDSIWQYKRAIIYENRNPFLYNEIGGVYFEAGIYNKSLIFIKRALRLFPENKVFEKNLKIIHKSML